MKLIGWKDKCRIYQGDALELLDVCDHAQIVFLDPPFNIGQDYAEYQDNQLDFYYEFDKWIKAGCAAVAFNGSLWLNLPDNLISRAVQQCYINGMKMENWCIWHYRFAQCQPNRFLKAKTHAVWFSKGKPIVNPKTALVPSDRATIYNDIRSVTGERMDFDVWGFEQYWGRVQGNNKERIPIAPNQLPEKYLKRVIELCSNEGDLVLDPFCGSGTTVTVAHALKRRCDTIDISEKCANAAWERLEKGMVRV